MHLGASKQTDSGVVPLKNAVLCLDCECVTNGRFDECAVCGSRSLLSITRMLGGTLQSRKALCLPRDESAVHFDLKITIDLKQMNSRELNETVEGIANLIAPSLGHGRAGCHINVEPVIVEADADSWKAEEATAA
jgi:hypothetical protein